MGPRLSDNNLNPSSHSYHTENRDTQDPDFGILFDIDGVIVRGKNILPSAPYAFQR